MPKKRTAIAVPRRELPERKRKQVERYTATEIKPKKSKKTKEEKKVKEKKTKITKKVTTKKVTVKTTKKDKPKKKVEKKEKKVVVKKAPKAKKAKTPSAATTKKTKSADNRHQAEITKKMKELASKSLDELKEMCKKNDLTRTGTKQDIIERVADAMVNGPPARCPVCFGGHLHYDKVSKMYCCKGFYDEDHMHRCSYSSSTIDREKWVD
ncbi:uncharacterized protein MONOS_11571 [Monocercomonoides exilis]|uniref:uncharacterized protein n=1 Tax=Monocercomonoides exilis TaxID=2049356 RepID=UPI0035594D1A|nr:hypothetical protein MONOS_11571 [Monocercomonoides exilis]|eukprot:MONOS_11571.1-p1 / transcript=MONOS_11571.1 / gene=MONOS_11571 / organism=Monocercomonoides_exilis_PA203 / gene_product=unspecified product / transcript_product=unspecified product / location=Mono_scaffold00588:375-1535(-) / protein_length=209 / sequence_SO=supercontig / SO=protein_coding / is_pseudo=false